MEQFEALPLPHKVLMVFLGLASIAGVFYFVLIGDLEEEIAASQAKVRKTEQAAAQLKRYENKDLMASLEAELSELKEQLAANKALLDQLRRRAADRDAQDALARAFRGDEAVRRAIDQAKRMA